MTKRKTIVCGMPRSGNNLINKMLRHYGFETCVRHFDQAIPEGVEFAILPLRHQQSHWASCKAHDEGYIKLEDIHYEHYWPILRNLAKRGIIVIPVVYEEIVEFPDRVGRHIATILDFKWKGWPAEIYNGNRKYE